ncbi:MAG: hypothetical protein MJZ06_10130 [Bacteroidaceae bacterium]|nr:hypothetical protein [Bacteroidaceae bacterium]
MFKHYLKIAFRNIRKYALQNTVSIIGLAAGFIALSLSSLWVNYENSYDTFHKDYDRIWSFYSKQSGSGFKGLVAKRDFDSEGRMIGSVCSRYKEHPEDWPEIEGISIYFYNRPSDGRHGELHVDEYFFDIFSIDVVAGNLSSLYDGYAVGISEEYAHSLFGDENPVGKKIGGRTVVAVFRKWSHTCLDFDMMSYMPVGSNMEDDAYFPMFIKVSAGTDARSLIRKIFYDHSEEYVSDIHVFDISQGHNIMDYDLSKLNIRNLKTLRTASILLVLCAVTNWLLLFLTGLGARRRELALRTVSGSTNVGLLALLTVEATMYLALASAVGVFLLALLFRPFTQYAGIGLDGAHFMVMGAAWLGALLMASLVIAVGAIVMSRRTQLRNQMESGHRHTMRKLSLFVQIAVSVMLAFCALVMLRQMVFSNRQDWGFRIKDTVVIQTNVSKGMTIHYMDNDEYATSIFERSAEDVVSGEMMQKLRSFAGVENVLLDAGAFIERPEKNEYLTAPINMSSVPYFDYGHFATVIKILGMTRIDSHVIGLTELEGKLPEGGIKPGQIVMTEKACQALGLEKPYAGQTVYVPKYEDNGIVFLPVTIEAVVADIYAQGPMNEPKSYVFENTGKDMFYGIITITVQYVHGMRSELERQLMQIPEISDGRWTVIFNEDAFAKLTSSEHHLMNILIILAVLCVLIAVFGVYSIVTLTCQERRREIAVRKIHGAGLRDILGIFVREYGLLLVLASALAFAVGYTIVHQWLQQFQRQAPVSWWLFAAVFAGMSLIICLTVAHRVLTTARENPYEVIKNE